MGLVVNLKKFQGACSKVEFSNSEWLLLKLRKFIENHINIRKNQTQFCWIPGENATTSVKYVHSFS
jgi:hypothetical protein